MAHVLMITRHFRNIVKIINFRALKHIIYLFDNQIKLNLWGTYVDNFLCNIDIADNLAYQQVLYTAQKTDQLLCSNI